jgi:hypothetical protein
MHSGSIPIRLLCKFEIVVPPAGIRTYDQAIMSRPSERRLIVAHFRAQGKTRPPADRSAIGWRGLVRCRTKPLRRKQLQAQPWPAIGVWS